MGGVSIFLSPSPLTVSSYHLLSPSSLNISSHHLLTISSHHLSSSPLTISHHLLSPSLIPSPLTVSLIISSHHLLSPSPLTISRTVSSHCISHYPKSPPHCCRQLPLSLVHIHTLTQGLRGLYRGMLAPLLAVTPLYALGFLGYGIGKQLQQRTPTEVLT